jgi:hypothetical protein
MIKLSPSRGVLPSFQWVASFQSPTAPDFQVIVSAVSAILAIDNHSPTKMNQLLILVNQVRFCFGSYVPAAPWHTACRAIGNLDFEATEDRIDM